MEEALWELGWRKCRSTPGQKLSPSAAMNIDRPLGRGEIARSQLPSST